MAPLSFQDFREWYDMYTDEEIDENFSAYLTSYLKSCQCNSEAKIEFLESFADKLRKDIDVLEAQIQSYDFHDKDQFFQDLFQPKQKGESLVFYYDFHNLQLKSYVEEKNTHELYNHGNQMVDYMQVQQTYHVFFDPVADYMEDLFNLNYQLSFYYGNKLYYQLYLLLSLPVFILWKHSQGV